MPVPVHDIEGKRPPLLIDRVPQAGASADQSSDPAIVVTPLSTGQREQRTAQLNGLTAADECTSKWVRMTIRSGVTCSSEHAGTLSMNLIAGDEDVGTAHDGFR